MTTYTLAEVLPDARPYVWLGSRYVRDAARREIDAPEPGETVTGGQFSGMAMCDEQSSAGRYALTLASERRDGGVRFVEIPGTLSGDYVGSLYETANRQYLAETYPDVFVTVRDDFGAEFLVARADTVLDDDETDLADVLLSLQDYPLLDEDTHTQLEMELISECWDEYAADDAIRETVARLTAAGFDVDRDDIPTPDLFDYMEETNEYPYAETTTSVVFPGLDDGRRHGRESRDYVDTMADRYLASLAPAFVAAKLAASTHLAGQLAFDGGESA